MKQNKNKYIILDGFDKPIAADMDIDIAILLLKALSQERSNEPGWQIIKQDLYDMQLLQDRIESEEKYNS